MLHEFLTANRAAVVEGCHARVAARLTPRPVPNELEHGIPRFLAQLIDILGLERAPDGTEGRKAAVAFGAAGFQAESQMRATAARHGHELLIHGFTVDQLVHDYGDLAQVVVELAIECEEAISRDAFATLGRCIDQATAEAVTEFYQQRDRLIARTGNRAMGERLGLLAQELRRLLNSATLSFVAIKDGGVGLRGATAAVLQESLVGMNDLIDHVLTDALLANGSTVQVDQVAAERFIAEAGVAASLEAKARECEFTIFPVEPGLAFHADKQMLHSAVHGLLQNAFKYTRPRGHVWLGAHRAGERVLIEVEDQSGGLPPGKSQSLFPTFARDSHRGDSAVGLSISRRTVEAMGGDLRVREMPGIGCVFTIDLPSSARE